MKTRQFGSALVIALIIVATVSLLAAALLYRVRISIIEKEAVSHYSNTRHAAVFAVKDYLNIPVTAFLDLPENGVLEYQNGNIAVQLKYHFRETVPFTASLYNAQGLRRYEVDATSRDNDNNITLNYRGYYNLPNDYRLKAEVETSQTANVPLVDIRALSASELNEMEMINGNRTGFVGDFSISTNLLQFDSADGGSAIPKLVS
ncbi:MAG: hypothetical protein ACO2ZM_05475 [Francisellaceae bacterium]